MEVALCEVNREYSFKEIAEALNMTETLATYYYTTAMDKIKKWLSDRGILNEIDFAETTIDFTDDILEREILDNKKANKLVNDHNCRMTSKSKAKKNKGGANLFTAQMVRKWLIGEMRKMGFEVKADNVVYVLSNYRIERVDALGCYEPSNCILVKGVR